MAERFGWFDPIETYRRFYRGGDARLTAIHTGVSMCI